MHNLMLFRSRDGALGCRLYSAPNGFPELPGGSFRVLSIAACTAGNDQTLVLAWAFLLHFCAGIRYLLMDTHRAVSKKGGKHTALVVVIVSSILTIAIALKLFGVF